MAEKFACMQCGFIFDDPDMEMCPKCGTELGKEWDPDELVDVLITDLVGANIPDLIRVIAEISGYPTQKIGPMLQKLPAVVYSGATPMQAEQYLDKIRATNAAAMTESSQDKSARLTAEAQAAGAAANAATEQARLSAAERQAQLEVEMKLKAEQAEAEAKARAEAEAKLALEKMQADAAAAEAQAQADAAAAALAAEQAKIKAAELEKIRLETEARKAEAEAVKAAEIARAQEEARLAAEKAAAAEAARIAQERELAETTVVCSKCGFRYDKNMKVCSQCGEKNIEDSVFYCQKCGAEYPPATRFCHKCGGKVAKEKNIHPSKMTLEEIVEKYFPSSKMKFFDKIGISFAPNCYQIPEMPEEEIFFSNRYTILGQPCGIYIGKNGIFISSPKAFGNGNNITHKPWTEVGTISTGKRWKMFGGGLSVVIGVTCILADKNEEAAQQFAEDLLKLQKDMLKKQ